MKKILKILSFSLIDPFFRILFRLAINKGKSRNVWIVDIDNTIADTVDSYHTNYNSNFERLRNLKVLKGSQKLIAELENTTVIYLTARSYIYYPITQSWLKKHGFLKSNLNLIMVETPSQKIPYLKKVAPKYNVTFIDDLSFNQENGTTKLYSEVIEEVEKLPITYHDYFYINSLNSLHND